MLSLLPNDPVRDTLDANVRHFSHLVNLATIAVALGVALEGVELIHALVAWLKKLKRRKRERAQLNELIQFCPVNDSPKPREVHLDEPPWVKRFLRVGLIIVVSGVVAEWRCGAELEDAHNAVHQYDLEKLGAVTTKLDEAVAELANAEEQEVVSRIHLKRYADTLANKPPRREVPIPLMISIFNKSPTATALILCRNPNGETAQTARGILFALMGAHWKISEYNSGGVLCVSPNESDPDLSPGFFPPGLFPLPAMNGSEILIIGNKKSLNEPLMGNSALGALEHALGTLLGGISPVTNERVPDGTFWILVGPAHKMTS